MTGADSPTSRRTRLLRAAGRVVTSLPGRIAISAALLAIVAASIDWDVLDERLSGAAWGLFALACLLVFVSLVLGGARWHLILHAARLPAKLRTSLQAYGVGAFATNFLPGVAGDAVRAWLVARSGKPLARALTSVGADRASSLACLLLLGWIGVLIAPGTVPGELVALLGAASGAALLGAVVAIVVLRRRGLGRLLPDALRPWAREVAEVLRGYGRDRELQLQALGLGLAFQAIMVAAFWTLSEALGLSIEPEVLAVVLPLVLLATLVPVSVAGFGVREGAFVVLLAEVGVPSSEAILLSLLSVPMIWIGSAPGGLALLLRHERLESPHEVLEDLAPDDDGRPGADRVEAGRPETPVGAREPR